MKLDYATRPLNVIIHLENISQNIRFETEVRALVDVNLECRANWILRDYAEASGSR